MIKRVLFLLITTGVVAIAIPLKGSGQASQCREIAHELREAVKRGRLSSRHADAIVKRCDRLPPSRFN